MGRWIAVNWLGIVLFPPDELMTVDGRTWELLSDEDVCISTNVDYIRDPANHRMSFAAPSIYRSRGLAASLVCE